jgi:glycosyl transferase family WbsX
MRRRDFLRTLSNSATLGVGCTFASPLGAANPSKPSTYTDVPAVSPGDAEAYFTEEKLRQAIDTIGSLPATRFEVVAYNYPGWHSTPFMDKAFEKGWTEFEVLRNSKPLYPGHLFPKYPLWGYFNEATPEGAEREIDAAANFGIDVWMIDWYWFSGTMLFHEQLENGFLKARNRSRLKFAIMWAFDDWTNLFPARSPNDAAILLKQETNEADMLRMTDYCIEHYFHQPNYWHIDGKLVLGIFNLGLFLKYLPAEQFKRTFEKMRERVARAGLGDLHLQASHGYDGHERELKALGFASATLYHTFGLTYGGGTPGSRIPYGDAAGRTIRVWKDFAAKATVPFLPDCPVGWDDSPRYNSKAAMVTQRSPDQYERLLRAAQYFSAATSSRPKIIFLSSWNEWTEDHVLLPDTVFGYSYLDAVRRTFRS